MKKLREAKAEELSSLMGVLFDGPNESPAAVAFRTFKAAADSVKAFGVEILTVNGQPVAVADLVEAMAAELQAKEEGNGES